VRRGHREHVHAGDSHALARHHLAHVREPDPAQDRATAAWHDDRHRALQPAHRRHVEVVEVQVREEHAVERLVVLRRRRRRASPQVREPVAQERVGEEPGTGEVETDGRMTQVRDRLGAQCTAASPCRG
jgi:hypothetical protein